MRKIYFVKENTFYRDKNVDYANDLIINYCEEEEKDRHSKVCRRLVHDILSGEHEELVGEVQFSTFMEKADYDDNKFFSLVKRIPKARGLNESNEKAGSLLEFIREKSKYFALMAILYFFYVIGYCFLYGYYFIESSDESKSLINIIMDYVPIKMYAGIGFGLIFLLMVIFFFSFIKLLFVGLKSHRLDGKIMTIVILVFTSVIMFVVFAAIFSRFGEIPFKMKMYSMILFMIVPLAITLLYQFFKPIVETPFVFLITFLTSTVCVIVIVSILDDAVGKYPGFIMLSIFIMTILLQLLTKRLKDILLRNKKKLLLRRSRLKNKRVNSSKKKKTKKQKLLPEYDRYLVETFSGVLLAIVLIMILVTQIPIVAMYSGSMIHSIYIGDDFSIISSSNVVDQVNIKGTVVSKDDEWIYISRFPEKSLLRLPVDEYSVTEVDRLNQFYSKSDFENAINQMKKECSRDNYIIEATYKELKSGYLPYHSIRLQAINDEDFRMIVSYISHPETDNIQFKMHVEYSTENKTITEDIINWYKSYLGIGDVEKGDSESFYINGYLKTSYSENITIIEAYEFNPY